MTARKRPGPPNDYACGKWIESLFPLITFASVADEVCIPMGRRRPQCGLDRLGGLCSRYTEAAVRCFASSDIQTRVTKMKTVRRNWSICRAVRRGYQSRECRCASNTVPPRTVHRVEALAFGDLIRAANAYERPAWPSVMWLTDIKPLLAIRTTIPNSLFTLLLSDRRITT